MNTIERFGRKINRQRTNPQIWDYPYLLLNNNLRVFRQFRKLTESQNEALRVLDIGCGFKPWKKLLNGEKTEYIGVDFDRERSSADYIASAEKLPFENNYFDALIYSEVLEHTSNLQDVLREMHRVAKNNALVYISSPFVFPEHGIPHDYQRLTRYYYQEAFRNDEIIVIKESNSSLSTIAVILNLFIESTPFTLIPLKYIFYAFTNIMGILIEGITKFGLYCLGKLSRNIASRIKNMFYAMPLGYSVIVKITK